MISLDAMLERRSREETDAFAAFATPQVYNRKELDRLAQREAQHEGCRRREDRKVERAG